MPSLALGLNPNMPSGVCAIAPDLSSLLLDWKLLALLQQILWSWARSLLLLLPQLQHQPKAARPLLQPM